MKDKGLGDTLTRFMKTTGIKRILDKRGKNCGCDKRKKKLNKMFPYKK